MTFSEFDNLTWIVILLLKLEKSIFRSIILLSHKKKTFLQNVKKSVWHLGAHPSQNIKYYLNGPFPFVFLIIHFVFSLGITFQRRLTLQAALKVVRSENILHIYRFPSLFAVNRFRHFGPGILKLQMKCPFLASNRVSFTFYCKCELGNSQIKRPRITRATCI